MKHKIIIKLAILTTLLLSNIEANKILTIGTIDGEAENKLSKFELISKYLENKLIDKKIKVNVEIPKNINEAIDFINAKKLDIFIDSVYPTLIIQKKTDITIEAKRWKKGQEGYKSIIFTKRNNNINSIMDLKGKTIAFEDNFSTSAYYVPKKAIEKKGIFLSKKKEKDKLAYLFSGSEENTEAWIIFDKVDVAATDNLTYKSFNKNQYKIIYQSSLIPRQLVSFSKRIKPTLKKEILDILLDMHNKKEGKTILKEFSNTKKFSKIKNSELILWNGE